MNRTGKDQYTSANPVPIRHEVRTPLKAHDVRHLAICAICGGMADRRDAISRGGAYWHPSCCFECHGADFVRELPHEEQAKFRLCDIPASLMKELCQ